MFYSFGLLVKSGGEFAIVWRLAHDGLKKVSRDDVLGIDIQAKCQALERYLPTGAFSAAEVKNKMSLYLLAVLQYGIVVAHARKTDFVLRDLKAAIALMQPSFLKPQKAQKRMSMGGGGAGPSRRKRARRSNMHAIQEEPEEEEAVQPAEDFLDMNLPSDAETDLPMRNEFGFEQPNIDDYLNMLELASNQGSENSRDAPGGTDMPPEMAALYEELASGIDFTMATLEPHHRREIDLTTTLPGEMQAEDQISLVHADGDVHMEDVEEPRGPLNLDFASAIDSIDGNLHDSFNLPTLTEEELHQAEEEVQAAEVQNRRTRRRRERRLIVDEQAEMTDLQMRRNLQSTDDICVVRNPPNNFKKIPTVEELWTPFPRFIPSCRDEFPEMFNAATEAVLERVRQSIGGNDFAQEAREIDFETSIINDQPFEAEPNQQNEPDEFAEPLNPTPLEIARRSSMRSREYSLETRGPLQPLIQDLVYNDTIINETTNEPVFDEFQDEQLGADVYEVLDITMPRPLSPLGELDEGAKELCQRIRTHKSANAPVVFQSICGRTKVGRARDFSNLLVLLKHRKFKAQQSQAYGPIQVM
ncbi:Meiotic recombination protein rec8 [Aphelenchoides besseyi]|nr:Meiotic recombination protein rec8 [Aphelenchoides besseyi]KAI6208556.1 Meiotic recombination protein rec8 [Aphelenchoides besseyi]